LRGEPIKSRPISGAARGWRWAKRNPAWAAAAVLTATLAVGGPLAAVAIESSRATIKSQLRKIEEQLDERNALIAKYERDVDAQSDKLQALRQQHDALVTANPGIERVVPNWRKKLIADYLKQHETAIRAAVNDPKLNAKDQLQAQIGLAYMLTDIDRQTEALSQFEAATGRLLQLVKEHSAADPYRLALADCYMQISQLQRAQNRKEDARKSAELAIAIRQDLVKSHPTNSVYQIDYLDAMLGSQSATAAHAASPTQSKFEEMAHLRQTQDVLNSLLQSFTAAPSDIYELSCYLTLRPPLLTIERQVDESK
jgi:chromosome segregation ATPase